MRKMRKCQACKKIQDADLMHKITREHKSGRLIFNPGPKTLGRSAYMCKKSECIKLFLKKRLLKGALKTTDTKEIEEILLNIIESK